MRLADQQSAAVDLPFPDGSFQSFHIRYSPVMAKALADRFPQIRTYAGHCTDDPAITVRLDRTPQGFHALVTQSSSLRTYSIDPIPAASAGPFPNRYVCYFHNGRRGQSSFIEGHGTDELPALERRSDLPAEGSFGGERLIYRLAVSATGEYTQYHGGRVVDGLSAIVTTVNRVNAVYERDLGVGLMLINENDQLVFTDPEDDPFTPLNERSQNQRLLDALLGLAHRRGE